MPEKKIFVDFNVKYLKGTSSKGGIPEEMLGSVSEVIPEGILTKNSS